MKKRNHHHGTPGDAEAKVGNGLLVWFVVDDFDAAAKREDHESDHRDRRHENPNAKQREIGLEDPDGYVVLLASEPNAT